MSSRVLFALMGPIAGIIPVGNMKDEYVTLAGLLLAKHEQMPTVGESFRFGDFRFDVLEISDRRIELVRVSRSHGEQEQEKA